MKSTEQKTPAFTLPATEQEVFDQVVERMAAQGFVPCTSDFFHKSRYRDGHGNCCAAGALIPDEAYQPEMEHLCWDELIDKRLAPSEHCDLVTSLQDVHDALTSGAAMAYSLMLVGQDYGLSIPAALAAAAGEHRA